MKVKKIRIKNYKSIIDSGDCFLEDSLTIFAGKNESGKTSILEALEDFNIDQNISESAKPISNDELVPEISIVFILTAEEINEYYKVIDIAITANESVEVEITKKYPDEYLVSEESKVTLGLDGSSYLVHQNKIKDDIKTEYIAAQKIHDTYFKPHGWKFFNLDFENLVKSKPQLNSYKTNYTNTYISHIPDQNIRNNYLKTLQEIDKKIKEYEDLLIIQDENWDIMLNLIPNFILFKSFEDNIPNEVNFENLSKTEFIKDLELISDLDTELILSKDNRKNQKHKESLNININKEYSQYWSQDLTSIKIDWNSSTLFLWIVEENEWYMPSQRSKGKQWHISFYTRISARSTEDRTNVILVDEPGMFLHASAQKDIYKKLLESANNAQIAFTTHSPYLIDANELHRVRLVVKVDTEHGTTVVNKVHAKADKETLTPILTAIGVELNQGIHNVEQKNNVVVEGPVDVLYLNKMMSLLSEKGINFIFGGGAGNLGNIGAILSGWGCNVLYLFDNDQGKKDGVKHLSKVWHISKDVVISISEDVGAIEDLFSKKDFQAIILNNAELNYEELNSVYLKTNKIDKVLLAKQFNSIKDLEIKSFSKETLDNFKILINKIKNTFEINNQEKTLLISKDETIKQK